MTGISYQPDEPLRPPMGLPGVGTWRCVHDDSALTRWGDAIGSSARALALVFHNDATGCTVLSTCEPDRREWNLVAFADDGEANVDLELWSTFAGPQWSDGWPSSEPAVQVENTLYEREFLALEGAIWLQARRRVHPPVTSADDQPRVPRVPTRPLQIGDWLMILMFLVLLAWWWTRAG